MLMKNCAKPRSYHKYRIQPKNLTSCSCAYVLRAPEPRLPTSENFELFSIQYYMAKSTHKINVRNAMFARCGSGNITHLQILDIHSSSQII